MKSDKKLANGETRRRPFLPRWLLEAFFRALANHTPIGPGSLATGQAGAAGRGGPYVQSDDAGKPAEQVRPAYIEYAMPLKQVFWI